MAQSKAGEYGYIWQKEDYKRKQFCSCKQDQRIYRAYIKIMSFSELRVTPQMLAICQMSIF